MCLGVFPHVYHINMCVLLKVQMLLQTLVSYFEFVCKFDDFVNIYLKTALSVDLCKTKRIRQKSLFMF